MIVNIHMLTIYHLWCIPLSTAPLQLLLFPLDLSIWLHSLLWTVVPLWRTVLSMPLATLIVLLPRTPLAPSLWSVMLLLPRSSWCATLLSLMESLLIFSMLRSLLIISSTTTTQCMVAGMMDMIGLYKMIGSTVMTEGQPLSMKRVGMNANPAHYS